MPGADREKKQWLWVHLLILSGLILTILATGLSYNEEDRWVGHAVAGVFSLILVITIMTTGGMLTGRLRSWENVRVFPIHRTVSIWFSIFVIGSFLFGLSVTALQGKPVLAGAHGLLGLVVAVMAAVQLIPSLLTKNRASLREVHKVVGYLLAPLVTLQVIAGLYVAVIGTGRETALLHSLTGGFYGPPVFLDHHRDAESRAGEPEPCPHRGVSWSPAHGCGMLDYRGLPLPHRVPGDYTGDNYFRVATLGTRDYHGDKRTHLPVPADGSDPSCPWPPFG